MPFQDIEAAAWENLADAANDPQSGYRYLTLCSVDAGFRPQARTVVLRRVDRDIRELEFHTDIRSPKWAELMSNPQATVLGYCPETRTQLRLCGTVSLFPSGTDRADEAWQGLSPWTRSTYTGGPPGDEQAFDTPSDYIAPSAKGGDSNVFGVVVLRATSLDWFQLERQANRRVRYGYGDAGTLVSSQLINP